MSDNFTDASYTIQAPIGHVWAVVTSFGAEKLWFPGVISSSLEGYGIGSTRTIKWEDNPWVTSVREVMTMCDPEQHHLRFRVYNDNAPASAEIYSNIVLKDVGGVSTLFRWFATSNQQGEAEQMAGLKEYVEDMYIRCAVAIEKKLLV